MFILKKYTYLNSHYSVFLNRKKRLEDQNYFLVFFAAVFLVVEAFFAFAILFAEQFVRLTSINLTK